jgi:3-oxoacyl-[acyl-carrier-protein] synthase-1
MATKNDMTAEPLAVTGFGMITSAGVSAIQTCASVDAGLSRQTAMPELYYSDPDDPDFEAGTDLIAAPITFLDGERLTEDPAGWLARIAGHAFSDLLDNSMYTNDGISETGLYMSLPPLLARRGFYDSSVSHIPGLEEAFVYNFHNVIEHDVFPVERFGFQGHTGVFALSWEAVKAIREGRITRAIICGVESCLFPRWLEFLDKDYRIKSERNIDGYVPGEAAAFIMIEKERNLPEGRTVFRIEGLSSSDSSTGGLKKTVEGLIVESDESDGPPLVVIDLNGESKRMKDWGLVRTALGDRLGNPVRIEHPADILGDTGAASGAVLTIAAMYLLQKKHRDVNTALVLTSSDQGDRQGIKLRTFGRVA